MLGAWVSFCGGGAPPFFGGGGGGGGGGGWGGAGSPTALYLAPAGVGTLGLMDADVVDITNLQRQVLHIFGKPKIESGMAPGLVPGAGT